MIPESHHSLLEPAAPQVYTHPTSTSGLTPSTSGSHRHDNGDEDDEEDDKYSVVSSRNGGNLFHPESKPRLSPTSIDTSGIPSSSSTGNIASVLSSITREGGLATTLYRNHRLSMETLAVSSTSYRDSSKGIDLQIRFQDLMSSSRASGASRSSIDGSTPCASFSDDYRHCVPANPSSSRLANTTTTGEATPRASISNDTLPKASFSEDYPSRPSLDTLRANMNASTPTSAAVSSELMSPLREQRASTASWSRYARPDSSGAAAN